MQCIIKHPLLPMIYLRHIFVFIYLETYNSNESAVENMHPPLANAEAPEAGQARVEVVR